MANEKLCLKWNDFQESVSASFGRLRQSNKFADVTLVCEDGEQIETHKIVLAAFSPFFEKVLDGSVHPHPMIYLKGIKQVEMLSILDFLYYGEANVFQDNLEQFLAAAEDLMVKGLTGAKKEKQENIEAQFLDSTPKPALRINEKSSDTIAKVKPEPFEASPPNMDLSKNDQTGPTKVFTNELQEHKERVNSMLQKCENKVSNNIYSCKVCGKEGIKGNIENHIDVHHLENVTLPCPLCDKVCTSRPALVYHKKTFHEVTTVKASV